MLDLAKDDDVSDLEIMGEFQASPDKVRRAREFELPDNYYLYEKKEPCKGCRGCEADASCHNEHGRTC